jgi:hypothetical protein
MKNARVGTRNEAVRDEVGFRARMEDQCQEIRRYRRMVMKSERRCLTLNEAALEWIERFAASYAERNPATGE